MDPKYYRLGLTGYPLGHSYSPVLHAAALNVMGMEGEYRIYPVQPLPGGKVELAALLDRIRVGYLQGLNVTIPHKESVRPFLDELSATARCIGAVNTIYMKGGRLVGDNTDAPGFFKDLSHFVNKDISAAVVLGAGGSARAVAYALAENGSRVYIAARRLSQAEHLKDDLLGGADKLGGEVIALPLTETALKSICGNCELIVNTTPVGMYPNVDESPWPGSLQFPGGAALYDLIYNPQDTTLVKNARAQGLAAQSGLGMLVEQAALAFECWTGAWPPTDVMRGALADMIQ